jgi:hypothetical protein
MGARFAYIYTSLIHALPLPLSNVTYLQAFRNIFLNENIWFFFYDLSFFRAQRCARKKWNSLTVCDDEIPRIWLVKRILRPNHATFLQTLILCESQQTYII